jgi:thiosulfate/3-mercaptopyruvate sulfurtransferase
MISDPLLGGNEAAALLGRAVFLDARADPDAEHAFERAHVRGALRVNLERDLSEPGDPADGGRHPLPPLEVWLTRLGSWGITPSTPVLIYDDAGGGMAAARAWWMLRAVGHGSVAVVDGGWRALLEAEIPIEAGPSHAEPPGTYPSAVERWPGVDATFVEGVRRDPGWRLIDARAPDRYAGKSEPIDPVPGHIPGASNLYWQSQLDATGRLGSPSALRARYAQLLGDVPPSRVICYCGSGVTACHLLWAMEACGLTGARLYVGSWSEWCRQGRPGDREA